MDFSALDATYSIYPQNATVRIPVTVLTDMIDENTENFFADLSVGSSFVNQVRLGQISRTQVNIMDGDGK